MLRPKAESTYQRNEPFIKNTHPEIRDLVIGPNHWVRMVDVLDLQNQYEGRISGEHSGKELCEVGIELHKELRDKYKIQTPYEFHFLNNNQENELFVTIVNRIEGTSIRQMAKEETQIYSKEIITLYTSVSQYYLDKLKDGGFFLTDISGASQYVIGTDTSDASKKENSIFIIDPDLYLDNRRESLFCTVYWFTRHLSGIENQLNVKLEDARKIIGQFIEEYPAYMEPKTEKDVKRVRGILLFLTNQPYDEEILPAIPTFDEA